MKILLHIAWCFCILAYGIPCYAETQPPPSFNHTVAVAFGGELSLPVAIRVSETMARIGAMQKAGEWLNTLQSVQLTRLAYEKSDPEILRDSQPLAWCLYSPIITGQEQIGTLHNFGVRSTATVTPQKKLLENIGFILQQPQRLLLYRKALDFEQGILRRFVHLSGSMPITSAPADALSKTFEPQFKEIANALYAITLYREALADLENSQWKHPETVLASMEHVLELAPDNPLLWHAKGTAAYQLGKTQIALTSLTRCLDLYPTFAQALHDRGTSYVRIHLTDLAIEDYNAAIELQPRRADFFRSRGSAYLLLEEFPAMCRDFYTACSLGQCENYHWASSRGHCSN